MMKTNIFKGIYYLWLILSLVGSIYLITAFWPDFDHNEFPLFNDFSVGILVLPSYFILNWGIIPHALERVIVNKYLKYGSITGYLLISYIFIVVFMDYKNVWFFAYCIICGLLGIMHFATSRLLHTFAVKEI
jgi:hypothetical protein